MSASVELGIPGLEDAEEIGRGGFALVYRAWQPAFARSVAVKVLSRQDLDEATRERFERERQVMGRLSSHPAIVTLYDGGFTEATMPYLVMEYFERGSLADRLGRDGTVPPMEVATTGARLAGALAAAHTAEVVHRDVKPANILVSDWDEPCLTDFGISRMAGAMETQTGTITASVLHAAPEVLNGDRPEYASDLYSLGSTLFHLLTGHAPFDRGDDVAVLPLIHRVLTEDPPDMRSLGVPPPLAHAIARSLAKDPADRPTSALEFGELLASAARAIPDGDIVVRPAKTSEDDPVRPDPAIPTITIDDLPESPAMSVGPLPLPVDVPSVAPRPQPPRPPPPRPAPVAPAPPRPAASPAQQVAPARTGAPLWAIIVILLALVAAGLAVGAVIATRSGSSTGASGAMTAPVGIARAPMTETG